MSSTYGENLKLSIFGQSHGQGIGITLDGIPAGLPVDLEKLQQFLNRRAPGQNDWSTPRKEEDRPEFLAGLLDGYTCGAPIAAVIYNKNTRSKDYSNLHDIPRPGHADYTAQVKYGGFQDVAGGGHFSGRLTAPLCIAGGLCKQWLEQMGIQIRAYITMIGGMYGETLDEVTPNFDLIQPDFPVVENENNLVAESMKRRIDECRKEGDSIGGEIECVVTGLPVGLGDPMFGGMESRIAQIVYGVPAVKMVEFGYGMAFAYDPGSECNDAYTVEDGVIKTLTNHNGGILGGITNGMPLIFRACIKPTPSISRPQQSISLSRMENTTLEIKGRHDPCIVPRAVPVIEAAAAIAVYDAVLARRREIGGI